MSDHTPASAVAKPAISGRLAFGLLGGPTAWMARLLISFPLIPYACETGHLWLLHLVALVFTAVATAALVVSARYRKDRIRSRAGSDLRRGRDRFLATLAVALSFGSLLAIALESLAIAFIDPCLR